VDVFVVEERYGEVTWQRVVREELNDPIESVSRLLNKWSVAFLTILFKIDQEEC